MKRTHYLETIIKVCKNFPILFTTGYTSREAFSIEDRNNHFYMVGSMGMVLSLGIGVAYESRTPTIIVDGDGSLLMNSTGLFEAAYLKNKNLIHILLDNGKYDSTGGQKTISDHFNFCNIASSIGYRTVYYLNDKVELEETLLRVFKELSGPTFILCKITEASDIKNCPRINIPLDKIFFRFSDFVKLK